MYDELFEKLVAADAMEPGREQLQLSEEVLRGAEEHGYSELALLARIFVVAGTNFTGAIDRSLVEFTKCLAEYDRDPDSVRDFVRDRIFWQFKWIADHARDFPTIPKDRVRQLESELESRYQSAGFNLRPVHGIRWENAMYMGDIPRFQIYWDKWQDTVRDEMANCEACEQNSLVKAYIELEKYEEALEYAEPLLAGRMTCRVVPHRTYASVLIPFIKLNRLDEAATFARKGYDMMRDDPIFVGEMASILLYQIRVGDLESGKSLVENHLSWAMEAVNKRTQMAFYNACSFLLETLAKSAETVTLNLPRAVAAFREDGEYRVVELVRYFQGLALEREVAFNARNENDYFTMQRAFNRAIAGL